MKILHATDLHAVSNDIDDNAEMKSIQINVIFLILHKIADNDSNDSNIVDDPAADTRNLKVCSSIHDTTTVHANIPPAPINVDIENDNIISSSDVNLAYHTYLNEIENWRDQDNNTKSRGKYLTNCPDVESIHLKPKFTTLPLLKNGNTLRGCRTDFFTDRNDIFLDRDFFIGLIE